jgi:sulfonate transport system substrate-binding protein
VKDLKGHNIAWLNGTILQYIGIRAVLKAGLHYPQDVSSVNLNPPSAGNAALLNGSISALVTSLANADGLVAAGTGRIIGTGAGLSRSVNYIVASDAALANPGKKAALKDFVGRLAKAQTYVLKHPATYTQLYATNNGIPLNIAALVLKKLPIQFFPISKVIVRAQQSEANVDYNIRLLSSPLNVTSEFDTEFNSVVAKSAGTTAPTS